MMGGRNKVHHVTGVVRCFLSFNINPPSTSTYPILQALRVLAQDGC